MYEIAAQLADDLDTEQSKRVTSWHNVIAIRRFQSLWEEVGALALFASQMIVHYQLDESETAELRLRIADAECGIHMTQTLIGAFREQHTELEDPIPSGEVESLIQQLQAALKK